MLVDIIGIFLLTYTIVTLLVYGFVITAVFLERKLATVNAFFTIYMAGCIADTLSLINGFFTYCFLTDFREAHWLNSQVAIHVWQIILSGARFSQMITVLTIAANRMTAIRFPMKHSRIWNRTVVRVCAFVQIASIIVHGGFNAYRMRSIRIPSTLGGFVTVSIRDPEDQRVSSLVSLILQSTNAVLVLLLYLIIIRDIRASLGKITSHSNLAHEGNLHKVAMIVCAVEMLSVLHVVVSTRLSLSREASISIYIVRTALYNSVPPYLLIIFCKNVRQRMIFMLTLRRRGAVGRRFTLTYT